MLHVAGRRQNTPVKSDCTCDWLVSFCIPSDALDGLITLKESLYKIRKTVLNDSKANVMELEA